MPQRSVVSVGATLLVASLALTACGSRGGSSSSTSGGGNSDAKVAKIGVIAPLSGDLAALGLGIKNSVDLAIKQANDSNAIPGWKLELAAEDEVKKLLLFRFRAHRTLLQGPCRPHKPSRRPMRAGRAGSVEKNCQAGCGRPSRRRSIAACERRLWWLVCRYTVRMPSVSNAWPSSRRLRRTPQR